ncbi:MAG: M48 family metalloprotease, partial [Desulfobacteraceae bacterium]|jgi:tetratricopeptide (TPR) repeat protein
MEILSTEELKAVIAHEMGHAKYKHMLFYVLFILGYVFALPGFVDLYDAFFSFLATQPFFVNLLESGKSETVDRVYLSLLLIALVTAILIYFRYVMGFFMRHFERQADLYSAVTMGNPRPTISSLEKIALLSGKIRDLPSWHHFSIKERVDCLWRVLSNPMLVKKHNRFVAFSFGIYFIIMAGGGYLLNFSPLKESLTYRLVGKALHQQLLNNPNNISLYQNLAMIYHKMENYKEAIRTYEQLIRLDENQAVALNNLAWLLVTVPDESLRDKARALDLAKRAVALDRSSIFLDTLAEVFYANGMLPEAVGSIKEAISLAEEGKEYYEKQLRRFTGKVDHEQQ